MKKFFIHLKVNSIDKAITFYCDEIKLFEFYQDFGMEEVALVCKNNKTIILLLSKGNGHVDWPVFSIEVENCEHIFKKMKDQVFETGAKLLNKEVFDYPLGKNITLKDPSGNTIIIFEEYK
ncbi:VOC family protein [Flavobacterium ardleyense]|uniref:VOC family protein n=1 Tax=Flavobacterium ardleyense TaxID=2038737 RepID=A0ABW5Z9N9_9FLAO